MLLSRSLVRLVDRFILPLFLLGLVDWSVGRSVSFMGLVCLFLWCCVCNFCCCCCCCCCCCFTDVVGGGRCRGVVAVGCFFVCVDVYRLVLRTDLLLLLRSPARSLGFTFLGEIFAYVTVF